MRKAAACLLVTLAASCSRTGLELETVANEASPEAGAETGLNPRGACPAPTRQPSPCTEWRITGSDTIVSGAPPSGGSISLSSLVPSGDGALVSWFTVSEANTASWTLALHLDGTPRSALVPHLSFPTMGGVYTDVMSLAVTPQCAFGGLVDDVGGLADDVGSGCHFLPLDGDGNEIGPVVSLPDGTDGGCGDLGPAPDGFSYIHENTTNAGALDLVTIATDGSSRGRTPLGGVLGFGTRLVLHDQSFLLASLSENPSGGPLTYEVDDYGASGKRLAPETTVAQNGGSILLMAETTGGVLTSYLGSDPTANAGQAMYVVPLSSSGAPYGPPRALDITGIGGPIYGFSLDPSPSGEALLTWNVLDETTNRYQLFVLELQPDGNPRGGPTALGTYEDIANVRILVGADGQRALLVYSGEPLGGTGGVHALPLACATL